MPQVGSLVHIKSSNPEGYIYRSWYATVESIGEDCYVTYAPSGNKIFDVKGDWSTRNPIRSWLWTNRLYNILEILDDEGNLTEIYVNIASPVVAEDGALSFTDYKLDVSLVPGQTPVVLDEDEFDEVVKLLKLPTEFIESCWQAVDEVVALLPGWAGGNKPCATSAS